MNKQELLKRMEEVGIAPKKSLGQNFLISENVISKISAAIQKKDFERIFEIGPGLGSLTDQIAQFKELGLTLIELDDELAEYWSEKGYSVVKQDALQVTWSSLTKEAKSLLVSNLPYQISSTLVMEVSSLEPPPFFSMILMFQKEVAERITAKPETKDFGLLTVVAQNRWKIKKVVDAAPACFHPPPKIASRVLQFDLDEEGFGSYKFMKFVKAAFMNRRKVLLKSLKGIDAKYDWEESLKGMGKTQKVRAEELSPQQWRRLYLDFSQRIT